MTASLPILKTRFQNQKRKTETIWYTRAARKTTR